MKMARKEIGKGADSFEKLRLQNGYYVDKTDFIQTVFGSAIEVLLLTRPRRFGKTLTMSTFQSFLSINPDNPGDVSKQLKLFEGTHILSDEGASDEVASRKNFVQNFMGKYPVIFLTLKSVDGLTFKAAYGRFADNIVDLIRNFEYLQDSPKLSDGQKEDLARLGQTEHMRDMDAPDDLKSTLKFLTTALHRHYGVPAIVLIDEYDVPLAKAEAKGYYPEMLDLIRAFLDPLKTNEHMYKAVLTGCLRVTKESIFTGINHFSVKSIFDDADDAYSQAVGFTKEETETLLDYYGLGKYKAQVKENYDGYHFGGISMFCPWDVLCFCEDAVKKVAKGGEPKFDKYWTNTSGNDIIDEFADYIKPEHIDDMQTLVDGGSIAVNVQETLNYPDLKRHEIDAFWTMLLFTGYLTVCAESSLNLDEPQQVRIPNLEIRKCFAERILAHYQSGEMSKSFSKTIAEAALSQNTLALRNALLDFLEQFISVRDTASKAPAENLYHGILNGLLGNASGMQLIKEYRSNQEAGDGYPDITFLSKDRTVAVVFELKQCKDEAQSEQMAASAVEQIVSKNYAKRFIEQSTVTTVYAYGICFCRKSCSVSVKKLK